MPKHIEVCEQEPVWEWYDYSWHRFDKKVEKELENAYKKNPTGETTIKVSGNQTYKVTFTDMKQMNMSTYYKRNVKRTVKKTDVRRVAVDELEKLFGKYKDETEGVITGEGIMKLAEDVNVDPMDYNLVVVFWKIQNETKFVLTKDEFVNGFAKLGMETFDKMKKKMPQIKSIVKDQEQFRSFYSYYFKFLLESEQQKRANLELAVPAWKQLFTGKWKYIDEWCEFIEKEYKQSISLDTWKQFYEFTKDPQTDNKNFYIDFNFDESVYPTAIDDFIAKMQERLKK